MQRLPTWAFFKVVRGQVEELVVAEVAEETMKMTESSSRTVLKGVIAAGGYSWWSGRNDSGTS